MSFKACSSNPPKIPSKSPTVSLTNPLEGLVRLLCPLQVLMPFKAPDLYKALGDLIRPLRALQGLSGPGSPKRAPLALAGLEMRTSRI